MPTQPFYLFAKDASTAAGLDNPIDDRQFITKATRNGTGDPELAAQALILKTIGERELTKAETQPLDDAAGIVHAVDAALRQQAEPFVRSRPDAVAAANAERRFRPILSTFSERVAAMEESLTSLRPILQAGESVVEALRSGVADADDLLSGHTGLIKDSSLTTEQKKTLTDVMFIRLKNENLDQMLSARFDKEKASAAKRLQGGPEARDPAAAKATPTLASATTAPDAANGNGSIGPTALIPS